MAYINEQTSSLADLVSKLNTFLSGGPGWTSDRHVPGSGEWAMSKTGSGYEIRFAAQWDTATPGNLGLYHYHGAAYNTGNPPYQQNDDSGNGALSTSNATLATARHVPIGNSPIQYWCFEDDHYFHVVVETALGEYRHFGAGQLAKFGDWTGGEYVYGHRVAGSASAQVSIQLVNTALLDGLSMDGTSPTTNDMELYVATVHVEALTNQPASGKYAVFMGNQSSANLGNDRQGTPRGRAHWTGGFRAGPYARPLGRFDGSDLSGHLPFYPMVAFYWDRVANDIYGPMGYMKDVRGCSIRNYVGAQEIVIGADTWMIFPTKTKWTGGAHTNTSDYQGIVYRKVTT